MAFPPVTQIPPGHRISDEFVRQTGNLASGVESRIPVVHDLGVVPSVVVGHLEDGSWSHQFGWRVEGRTATGLTLVFLNHGPNTGSAALRFRLLY